MNKANFAAIKKRKIDKNSNNDCIVYNSSTANYKSTSLSDSEKQRYRDLIQKLTNDAVENKFVNKKFKTKKRLIEKKPIFSK